MYRSAIPGWTVVLLLAAASEMIMAAADRPAEATLPLTYRHGQIHIPARVNGSEPMQFMLDTGFSMTMLRPSVAETLKLERVGEITVQGIAGEERAPTYEGAVFDFGGARYQVRRLGAMAATRRQRDGIIGSGLFRQFVVDVNPGTRTVSLINPSRFSYTGTGEVVTLRFRRSTPIIAATLTGRNDAQIPGEFEIDTGCDSGICIGRAFTDTNNLLALAETKSGAKFGVGGGATTLSGHLPELRIGKLKVARPQTDFFTEGSPADRGLAGHIGMGVFRDFRVVFDYSRKQMILEPVSQP